MQSQRQAKNMISICELDKKKMDGIVLKQNNKNLEKPKTHKQWPKLTDGKNDNLNFRNLNRLFCFVAKNLSPKDVPHSPSQG